jgi:hypothetical protein
MKSATLLLLICLSALVSSGAERGAEGPPTPAALIAKTVTWQVHWDNRAGIRTKVPPTITFKTLEESKVWVAGLEWIITFVYQDHQPFPQFVQRLSASPDEVRQKALAPFVGLKAATVTVPAYGHSFGKLSKVEPVVRAKLVDAFRSESCSAHMLAFYKDETGQPVKRVRFWIAPVDPDFPVMRYIVEGVPYVGTVNFDTRTFKPLYVDFDYIGDAGTEPRKQGLRLIHAAQEEGDCFELRNDSLLPVTR